jgi:hypothetical protein
MKKRQLFSGSAAVLLAVTWMIEIPIRSSCRSANSPPGLPAPPTVLMSM